jgi:hypothetical protein
VRSCAAPFHPGTLRLGKSVAEYPDHEKNLRAAIAALDDKAVAQLVLDLALVGELNVSIHSVDKSKPEQLLDAAARVGVDPEPIKVAVKTEAKAKADAKKKPTANKVEGKKPAATPAPKKPAAKKAKAKTAEAPPATEDQETLASEEAPAMKYKDAAWPFPTEARRTS